MTNKIEEYRTKHPRCRYCKYSKHVTAPVLLWGFSDYHECVLKAKIIKYWFYDSVAGMFCKYYECGDIKIDEV